MITRLFAHIWRHWLLNVHTGQTNHVIRVTGIRSCIAQTPDGHKYETAFYGWPWQNKPESKV